MRVYIWVGHVSFLISLQCKTSLIWLSFDTLWQSCVYSRSRKDSCNCLFNFSTMLWLVLLIVLIFVSSLLFSPQKIILCITRYIIAFCWNSYNIGPFVLLTQFIMGLMTVSVSIVGSLWSEVRLARLYYISSYWH